MFVKLLFQTKKNKIKKKNLVVYTSAIATVNDIKLRWLKSLYRYKEKFSYFIIVDNVQEEVTTRKKNVHITVTSLTLKWKSAALTCTKL